jgi:ketosteroid isomerase-like protein
MFALTAADFEAWLRGYKAAWEARDAAAAAALFTPDAEYFWTPFDAPQKGPAEIAAAWSGAVQRQEDVTFDFTVVATAGAHGIAHWHTRLTSVPDGEPVELDGIIIAEFARPAQCRVFREWWHARGKPG